MKHTTSLETSRRLKPKIRITAINEKLDGKKAKLMEKMVNMNYERYGEVIEAIVLARNFITDCYGIETPDSIWDRIASKVVKLDISNLVINPKDIKEIKK